MLKKLELGRVYHCVACLLLLTTKETKFCIILT